MPLSRAIKKFLYFLSVNRADSDNNVATYRIDLQQLADYVDGCLPR